MVKEFTFERLALKFHYKLYSSKCTPYRLRNAPEMLRRLLELSLSTAKAQSALVYLDNIVTFPRTPEDHDYSVRQTVIFLYLTRPTLKLNNYAFCSNAIDNLKHFGWSRLLEIAFQTGNSIHWLKSPDSLRKLKPFLEFRHIFLCFVTNIVKFELLRNERVKKYQTATIRPQKKVKLTPTGPIQHHHHFISSSPTALRRQTYLSWNRC